MHRLITGPAPALDHWLLADLPALLAAPGAPRRVVLLSGAGLAGKRLEDRLTAAGVPRAQLVRHSISSFADRLMPAGAAPALPVDGDDAILRRLAGRLAGSGPLAAALDRPGLRRAVLRTIGELLAAGFTSEAGCAAALQAASQSAECGNPELLRDLGRLLQPYQALLAEAGFAHRAARLAAAAANVEGGASLPGPVYLHGHLALIGLEQRLVRALAGRVPVTALLAHDGTPASRWLDDERAFFRSLGCVEQRVTDSDAPPALAHLRAAWAAETPASPPEAGPAADGDEPRVTIIAAPSPARELREAARAAVQAAGAGVPPAAIAILFRDGPTYRRLAHDVLTAAGIPHYLPGGLPLIEWRAGRALAQMLALAGPERRRPELLDLLLTAPLRWEALLGPGSTPEPEAWDRLTREAGVTGGDAHGWRERMAHHRAVLEGALAQAEEPAGPRARALREDIARVDTLTAAVSGLLAALDALRLPLPWAEAVARLEETVTALLDGAALPDLAAVWPALRALDGLEPERRPEALHDAVTRILSDEAAPVGVFGHGVFVGDLTNARGLSFDSVILVGVAERAFPAPPPRDPVLDEGTRRAINAAAAMPGAPQLAEYRPGYEELLFHQVLSAARRHLVLLYPFQDAEGRGRQPSHLLSRVREVLAGRLADRRISPERLAPDDPAAAISPLEFDLAEMERALTGKSSPARLGYLDVLSPDFARARAALAARASHLHGAHGGVFAGAAARERLAAAHGLRGRTLSATDIELYARCPRRYFFARVLRLEPLEEPEDVRRIRPDRRGTLVHAILERFYRETQAAGELPLRPELVEQHTVRLLAVAARCFAEAEAGGQTGAALVWEVERAAIEEDLTEWLTAEIADATETGLIPDRFETAFGLRDGFPAVSVEVDGVALRFRARLDRIDRSRDGQTVRVVDYKSGRVGDERDGRLRGGATMQLPVYLHAARALHPAATGSAEYHYVTRAGAFKRVRFDEATLEARREDFGQVLRTVADGVNAGRFFPHPGKDGEHCRFCPFVAVCEARIQSICAGRAADPDTAAFLTLGEIA